MTKQDIASAAATITTTLAKSERAALQAQLNPGEGLITPACTPNTTADHRIGEEAEQVTVTVSETCSSIAYLAHNVYQDATQMITKEAVKLFGTGYTLMGYPQVRILPSPVSSLTAGIVTVAVKLNAIYAYQLSPGEKHRLINLIAGKPKHQALLSLLHQPGIQAAAIAITGDSARLPQDLGRITIIVVYQD